MRRSSWPRSRARSRAGTSRPSASSSMSGAYLYELPGTTPYGEALTIQQDLAGARSQQAIPDVVMLVEHDPVISLGSRAVPAEELLLAAVEYASRGIDLVEVSRGGRST